MSSLLQTVDLRRVFSETGEDLEILKGVNFLMEAGELVALTGSSGSGKSTFLNLVGMQIRRLLVKSSLRARRFPSSMILNVTVTTACRWGLCSSSITC